MQPIEKITQCLPFQSTHKLDFMACPWEIDEEWTRFRVGTCRGLYRATTDTYDILAIDNEKPGNGHFEDVMQWFENSCRRDGKSLRFMVMINDRLRKHLIGKRGFKPYAQHDLIKHF